MYDIPAGYISVSLEYQNHEGQTRFSTIGNDDRGPDANSDNLLQFLTQIMRLWGTVTDKQRGCTFVSLLGAQIFRRGVKSIRQVFAITDP